MIAIIALNMNINASSIVKQSVRELLIYHNLSSERAKIAYVYINLNG